ncbi:uncharacterized protein LOC121760762 [Salvia splendens]|uniref:uncharacterized protein LOC121760762 n=1 Tax=Salvia splendens TaxID=180675 RepID=UPI001C2531DA|nr:uncharacterized protein LOC121760762 [Salvia splendens]
MSDEPPKPTETEQFARMFAEFMRVSIAQNQSQITNPIAPDPTPYRIDSSPLVIAEKLNGDNYPQWSILMKAAIGGRGDDVSHHWSPTPPAKTDPTFGRWQQADHCVFTWLTQNVEPRLVSRLTQYPTARDIWVSIEVTYASGSDKIQVYDLYAKAITLKQKDEPLEEIWTKLNDLWISIDRRHPNLMKYAKDINIYHTEKQEQRLFQLLVALNSKYESIKKEILRTEPLPSAEAAYAILRREDVRSSVLQTEDSGTQGIGAGLAVTNQWQHRSHPQRSGGGIGGGWNKRTEEDKSRLICSHCGKKKHSRETCFEIHGYPEWWQERKTKPPPAPSKGNGRAAAAIGGGEPVAAIGSNVGAANHRGGYLETGGATTGVATFARGGDGAIPSSENKETAGTLGFEDEKLPSNPSFFKLSKKDPPYPDKLHNRPRKLQTNPKEPRNCRIATPLQKFPKKPPIVAENSETAPILCKNQFQILDNLPESYALNVSSEKKNDKWIFDCGATDTITYDISDISNMHRAPKSHIQTASGEFTPVEGAGTVTVSSALTLSNCLYVPSMSHKLLSISHVTKELNCTLLMQPTFCLLQDIRTGEIIGRGTERDGLYYVDEITQRGTALLTHGTTDREAWLWHRRLGHPSTGYLKILFPKFSQDMYCETCALAKSHRHSYISNNTRVDSLFALVHSDV